MSIFDFFKNLFTHQPNSNTSESEEKRDLVNDFLNPIWDTYESDSTIDDFRHNSESFTFNMYSDPVEMHRFFEQTMNEMMKNFQMFGSFTNSLDQFFRFDSSSGSSPFDEFSPHPPAIEGPKKNLRDELLKPGYNKISKGEDSEKSDIILDGRINSHNIGKILDVDERDEHTGAPSIPGGPLVPAVPGFSFVGKSYASRTIRHPDGTTEKEEIVRDSNGNEKKTITRSTKDGGEYTVTTFKDAAGRDVEGIKENFIIKDPFKDSGGWDDPFFKNFSTWDNKRKWWSW